MARLIKKLKNYVLLLALVTTFSPGKSHADDIFKALRGPTNWQIDSRLIYSKKDIETLTSKLILKYWDGDKFGKWGFISLPYESVGSHKGLGNISIGSGPWGKIGNVGGFLYGALTFPKGNRKVIDKKVGILSTYITPDKKYELDAIVQYTWAGENINSTNETYIGLVGGGKITDKIRMVTGLTALIKENGNYFSKSRSVVRYTFSPTLHLELVGDIDLINKNIPHGNVISLFSRYNF